jgi:hypothetical protein
MRSIGPCPNDRLKHEWFPASGLKSLVSTTNCDGTPWESRLDPEVTEVPESMTLLWTRKVLEPRDTLLGPLR